MRSKFNDLKRGAVCKSSTLVIADPAFTHQREHELYPRIFNNNNKHQEESHTHWFPLSDHKKRALTVRYSNNKVLLSFRSSRLPVSATRGRQHELQGEEQVNLSV